MGRDTLHEHKIGTPFSVPRERPSLHGGEYIVRSMSILGRIVFMNTKSQYIGIGENDMVRSPLHLASTAMFLEHASINNLVIICPFGAIES